jgi:hypothetical protein
MGYFRANVRLLQEQECARSRSCNAGVTKSGSGDGEEAQSKVKNFGIWHIFVLRRQCENKARDRTVVETRTLLCYNPILRECSNIIR